MVIRKRFELQTMPFFLKDVSLIYNSLGFVEESHETHQEHVQVVVPQNNTNIFWIKGNKAYFCFVILFP